MIRSKDSAGHGLLYYARDNLSNLNSEHLGQALFCAWDYKDECFGLRLDPLEDKRYALSSQDPSTDKDKSRMLAPNCLAVEALRLFPTMIMRKHLKTTAFKKFGSLWYFVWPIWIPQVGIKTLRSLLALDVERQKMFLNKTGVITLYRSERIASSKYYHNLSQGEQFTP